MGENIIKENIINKEDIKIIAIPSTRIKDLTDQFFGKWHVIGYVGNDKSGKASWLCQCSCDNKTIKIIVGTELVKGKSKSCGCLIGEMNKIRSTTHGMTNTRLHRIWNGMHARCYNKNSKDYKHYGKRGIIICKEWLEDFMNFYNWAAHNGYQKDLTIDRIDVDKNYCPENCRWVSTAIQNKNKTTAIKVTYKGKEWILKDLVDILGLTKLYSTIFQRIIRFNWSVEDAINKPINIKNQKQIFIEALYEEFKQKKYKIISKTNFCNKYKINRTSLYDWLRKEDIINLLNELNIKFNKEGDFVYEKRKAS